MSISQAQFARSANNNARAVRTSEYALLALSEEVSVMTIAAFRAAKWVTTAATQYALNAAVDVLSVDTKADARLVSPRKYLRSMEAAKTIAVLADLIAAESVETANQTANDAAAMMRVWNALRTGFCPKRDVYKPAQLNSILSKVCVYHVGLNVVDV